MTGFYLSPDATYSSTDRFWQPPRGRPWASGSETASTQLIIPPGTAPGIYYVIGAADVNKAVAESLETNNTRSQRVDAYRTRLVVTTLAAPSAVAGTSISASDTTKNQGGDTAPASGTRSTCQPTLRSTQEICCSPLGRFRR